VPGTRLTLVGNLTGDDVAPACCAPLGAATLAPGEAEATAALFKALADPQRVRIVNQLANSPEPVCACDFEAPLGLAQPTVSHHLRKLTDAGLLRREQRGKWAFYSLDPDALRRLAAVVDLPLAAATPGGTS
jgi:ArsR family transcriptional regulator